MGSHPLIFYTGNVHGPYVILNNGKLKHKSVDINALCGLFNVMSNIIYNIYFIVLNLNHIRFLQLIDS